MNERCKGRRCLREVNPEQFPGVYWGAPGDFDLNVGCCVDCERAYTEGGKVPDPNLVWNVKVNMEEFPVLHHHVITGKPTYECPACDLKIPVKRRKLIQIKHLDFRIHELDEEIEELEKKIQEEEGRGNEELEKV